MSAPHIRLTVAGSETTLTLVEEGNVVRSVVLPWSWRTLRERFIHHAIPTEAEVEHAINFIEDELAEIPQFRRRDDADLRSDAPARNQNHPSGSVMGSRDAAVR